MPPKPTPDQPRTRALAPHVVERERDLERCIHGLGSGVAEEHVVEVAGCERGHAARELEGLGVGELKCRGIVELRRLRPDGRHDGIAIVTGVGAPQAGGAVEHGTAFRRVVVHVLGARDEPRRSLEGAVGRERQPVGFEVIGNGGGSADRC